MTDFQKALVKSSLAHGLIIVLLVIGMLGGTGDGKAKAQGSNTPDDQQTIVEKPQEKSEPTEIEVVKVESIKKVEPPKTPHANDKCESSFGGIGVSIASGTSLDTGLNVVYIDKAYAGYPAYEGGIRALDKLISPFDSIKGEVGTEVEVIFQNAEGVHTVKLIRDKICTEIKKTGAPE